MPPLFINTILRLFKRPLHAITACHRAAACGYHAHAAQHLYASPALAHAAAQVRCRGVLAAHSLGAHARTAAEEGANVFVRRLCTHVCRARASCALRIVLCVARVNLASNTSSSCHSSPRITAPRKRIPRAIARTARRATACCGAHRQHQASSAALARRHKRLCARRRKSLRELFLAQS